jgi:hypothetical protein
MTRRDFELIAQALKEQRPGEHWDANKHVQWDLDVKALAKMARAQNLRFDFQKFYAACGGLFNVQ